MRQKPEALGVLREQAIIQSGLSGDATSAKDTPETLDALCRNYREALDDKRVPPLLVVATLVFDLLCIHPFRDGNGRVSRLATTLLLQAHDCG